MATLAGFLAISRNQASSLNSIRNYSLRVKKIKKQAKPNIKFEPVANSLKAKGFLRSIKPYLPPMDTEEKLVGIFERLNVSPNSDTIIEDPAVRFSILKECFGEFKHGVPNSILNTVKTVGDIIDFYKTPVDTTTPFDAMKKMDLPKNLQIQYEYKRFHPDTDTMFKGISAFPLDSCLVTGLKYKKKYPGFVVKKNWLK